MSNLIELGCPHRNGNAYQIYYLYTSSLGGCALYNFYEFFNQNNLDTYTVLTCRHHYSITYMYKVPIPLVINKRLSL